MKAHEQLIIRRFEELFPLSYRPDEFTNRNHCSECAEHDDTLQSHTPDTISLEELGNPGWDPICFTSPEGYFYYISGLARLCLDFSSGNYYLDTFLFHLHEQRILPMDHAQSALVHDFLCYIRLCYHVEVNDNDDMSELTRKIKRLAHHSQAKVRKSCT